jgi:hypothetical protein
VQYKCLRSLGRRSPALRSYRRVPWPSFVWSSGVMQDNHAMSRSAHPENPPIRSAQIPIYPSPSPHVIRESRCNVPHFSSCGFVPWPATPRLLAHSPPLEYLPRTHGAWRSASKPR